ncbi:hypothetical protein N0V93_007870 [Gnomoniopsis smithogilvyi]|uniref:Uncharacterized protein n=1 Tax=Gnomoniopsis smithogilvyi TaxID=1191159 RepID=A0A9W8YLL5_9PEZI|nr:hypothetical protein N0V93_007870 [Gnomoniopsis smithogilvyi]
MTSLTKSDINARCRATIETSYPLFVIHTNHVTTLPSVPLHTLCEQIYTTALTNLSLHPIAHLLSLRAILTATLDPSHVAFVLPSPSSAPLLAALPEDARGPLFAQAIAGLVSFLGAIATCPSPATEERVAVKLERFAASEERQRILKEIEGSAVWGDCFEKAQIGELIMRAVGVKDEEMMTEKRAGDVTVLEVDEFAEAPALWHDGPHLKREFGVPDQFRIMMLN